MSNKEELINKLTSISRIKISDDSKEVFSKKITDLLNWFEIINEVDTKDFKPMFNVTEKLGHSIENLRKDEVKEKDNTEAIIKNAPSSEDVFIAVPKVIE